MIITKDKNLIIIKESGASGQYVLNINTGEFLGKKGGQIKRIPYPLYDMRRDFGRLNTTLGHTIESIICYKGNSETRFFREEDVIALMKIADKLDSLNRGRFNYDFNALRKVEENYKAFVKYINNHEGEATNEIQNGFFSWLEFEQKKQALGQYADLISPEMYSAMTNRGRADYSLAEWKTIAYYLNRGRLWEYHEHNVNRLVDYLEICRKMNKTPNEQTNFMREYVETKNEYILRQKEYDNNKLVANYKAKEKAFTFTYGDYSVVVPTCTDDIINEGANMHHCVGGYVGDVVDNRTYIVFVRRTDTPNQCYITAQVRLDGRLGQYYLAYDNRISEQADIDFYRAFQTHLTNNW
jgi:hypothetical protein